MSGYSRDVSICDAYEALDQRKHSVGFYDNGAVIESEEQLDLLTVSLDIDLTELGEMLLGLSDAMIYCMVRTMQLGHQADAALRNIYLDAFVHGIMYEKMRKGDL